MIRLVCKDHNTPLTNIGNGRFLFPTCSSVPQVNEEGWMEVDFSEYYCRECNDEDGGGSWELEVQ